MKLTIEPPSARPIPDPSQRRPGPGRLVDVTDKRSDSEEDGAPRRPLREFHQLPNLVVPQDFDAPLPEDEYAAWEDRGEGESSHF